MQMTKTRTLKLEEKNPDRKKHLREQTKKWTAFFRANPHRFVASYLGIELYPFQMIILYMFDVYNHNMLVCSRGTGKTFITAIYAITRCILYPGTQVVIGASTKQQATILISEKIGKILMPMSPNLRNEVKEIKYNSTEAIVEFHNGSEIVAVVSGEQSRGLRAQVLITDEFRLVPKNVLESIMIPFLNVPRQPRYRKNPKYFNYPVEESKEIYLTSAFYKSAEAYERYLSYVKNMAKDEDYFVLNSSYKLAEDNGLLTKAKVATMRKDLNEITWLTEMESLWWGENAKAFFKSGVINPCRTITRPFYPPNTLDYLNIKNGKMKKTEFSRNQGEIRIVGADIAVANGDHNDNSIYTLMRLYPLQDGEYRKEVVYMEAHNGMEQEKQAIRIKQLYYDFEADYLIVDTNGIGHTVWGEMQKINYDIERGKEYPAFTSFNNDSTVDKVMARNALPIVYSFKGTKNLNNDMAMNLREAFVTQKMRLPINDLEAREMLIEIDNEFLKKSPQEQAELEAPFVQATALVNETVSLEFAVKDGLVKVSEVGSARKDRYSSLAMTNFLADYFIKEEDKKIKNNKDTVFAIWG